MFNFFDEIKDKCHDMQNKVMPYKIILVGDYLLYFEGKNKLITLGSSEVVFKAKDNIISVLGDELKIKEIQTDTLTIIGKIKSIESV